VGDLPTSHTTTILSRYRARYRPPLCEVLDAACATSIPCRTFSPGGAYTSTNMPAGKLLQILIVVDVQGAVDAGELEALLPDQRDERRIFSLCRDGDAPAVVRQGPEAQPIDWLRLGRAVEAVARKVREASVGRVLELYVGGQGPLPVFTHLGHAISKFNGAQTIIARRRAGAPLELFPLTGAGDAPHLLVAGKLPAGPSRASGQVAVYVDVQQRADDAKFRSAIERASDKLADVVELVPREPLDVAPENVAGLAAELDPKLSRLPSLFPHCSLGVFVGGPTPLAFAVGRALNPTVVPSAMLYDHGAGRYEPVYGLPFADRSEPALPTDEASTAARAAVKDVLRAAVEVLPSEIDEADLAGLLPEDEQRQFLQRLEELRYVDAAQPELSLSIAHGTFSFGEDLLEALRNGEAALQGRFAKLLLLHELFHEHQGIRSTNYRDVGRAGVVLEAIDFAADVFALRVAIRGALRRLEASAPSTDLVRLEVTRWLDAVLYGIQVFDRWQHGPRIAELADRRLRRYLTWYLQRVRGETVTSAADVPMLLDPAVTVELAPLSARIDRRYDRQVIDAIPQTELFASVGGRLIRHAKNPSFDPGALVEAVRVHDADAVKAAMRYVIGENLPTLAPWRP
jgi:hypothetical protein